MSFRSLVRFMDCPLEGGGKGVRFLCEFADSDETLSNRAALPIA